MHTKTNQVKYDKFDINNYRELKNRATGIDIFVPQYEHISGSFGGSVLYNVIVVTRLFYFKIPSKHKESDVVQFMVSFDLGIFFFLIHNNYLPSTLPCSCHLGYNAKLACLLAVEPFFYPN